MINHDRPHLGHKNTFTNLKVYKSYMNISSIFIHNCPSNQEVLQLENGQMVLHLANGILFNAKKSS
jgi:hypothetical protein